MFFILGSAEEEEEEKEEQHQQQQTHDEIVGIPKYIASGSHYFTASRYRFLIMPRYKTDLHSITKVGRLSQKHFLVVASQIIDVLMHLHSKQYVHSDIKAENIMIGLCRNSGSAGYEDNSRKGSKGPQIEFSGANPLRSCRVKDPSRAQSHQMLYNDMVRSHYLRPSRSVAYAIDENSRSTHTPESEYESSGNSAQDEDFELSPRKRKARRAMNKAKGKRNGSRSPVKNNETRPIKKLFAPPAEPPVSDAGCDDKVFVIDYGLATKFIDTNGEHKPFCMDQRRAHDGTLEFTSRDAHFGAHSRRSDLECLGYNLIYWSQGFLPWKDEKLKEQPEIVHRLKEVFMTDCKKILKLLYGKDVPRYLGDFMQYVSTLEFDEEPNYAFLKGLFEKEFMKLGYKKSEMKLNLMEMREQCELIDRSLSENDLMNASISDMKTARKLGFLIVTDCVDGTEPLTKPNESISLNVSCKASPKNLRSKEKTKGKRPKRQPKATEKELISEKMAQGKKLSIAEIATLDPDQIARDRADREYEKFDEKVYYQTPKRYQGNPTYAILEIQNKMKSKQSGLAASVMNGDIEPIKGYTKPMMDVLKKQQMMVEQQLTPVSTLQQKRSRDGLRNVIKPTKKNLSYKRGMMKKRGRKIASKAKTKVVEEPAVDEEIEVPVAEPDPDEVPLPPRRKRGRPRLNLVPAALPEPVAECDDTTNDVEEVKPPVVKRKRGRPKIIRNVIEPPETEEDSVYYDIPGEGSNDGVKEMSEDENEPGIISKRSSRRVTPSDENSNQESVASGSSVRKKKHRGRYYADDDYDASTDEATNMSSASNISQSSDSSKPLRVRLPFDVGTRNKVKSRSTSRSAAAYTEATDQSECSEAIDNDSEYQIQSGDESGEEIEEQEHEMEFDQSETEAEDDEDEDNLSGESEMADESNDSGDSIDIKYSPIKTRHARRRINHFSIKQIRGKVLIVIGLKHLLIEINFRSSHQHHERKHSKLPSGVDTRMKSSQKFSN